MADQPIQSLKVSWDDLRIALALARAQTMAGAAEVLQVHQTTVSRRMAVLEECLSVRLFDRVDKRFAPTEAGRFLIRRAEKMELVAADLTNAVEPDFDGGKRVVRISAVPTLLTGFLVPYLRQFANEHAGIRLELLGENRNVSLERREADIALRYTQPTSGSAVIRKLAQLGSAIYADGRFLNEDGQLKADAPWIGFARPVDYLPEAQWIEANVDPARVVLSLNGGPAYCDAVASGIGVGVLNCIVGDARENLVRIDPGNLIVVREIWMLVLDDSRRRPAIRETMEWLKKIFDREKRELLGQ